MLRNKKHHITYKTQYLVAAMAFATGTFLYIMARRNNDINKKIQAQENSCYVPTTLIPKYVPKHNAYVVRVLPTHIDELREKTEETHVHTPVAVSASTATETVTHSVPVFSDTGDKRMSIIAAIDTLTSDWSLKAKQVLCVLEMVDTMPNFTHITCVRTLISPLTANTETEFKATFLRFVRSNDNSFGKLYNLLHTATTDDFSAQLAKHIREISALKDVSQDDNMHLIQNFTEYINNKVVCTYRDMVTRACAIKHERMQAFKDHNVTALDWLIDGTITHKLSPTFYLVGVPFQLLQNKIETPGQEFDIMYNVLANTLYVLHAQQTDRTMDEENYNKLVCLLDHTIQACDSIVVETVDMHLRLFAYYTCDIIAKDDKDDTIAAFYVNVMRISRMLQYTVSIHILRDAIFNPDNNKRFLPLQAHTRELIKFINDNDSIIDDVFELVYSTNAEKGATLLQQLLYPNGLRKSHNNNNVKVLKFLLFAYPFTKYVHALDDATVQKIIVSDMLVETITDMPICIASVMNMCANEYIQAHGLRGGAVHEPSVYTNVVNKHITNLLTDCHNVELHNTIVDNMLKILRQDTHINSYLRAAGADAL